MIIKTGCDLVYIERFKKIIERDDHIFLKRVFTPHEILSAGSSCASLAGIFAAKEATIKALDLPPDSWLILEIVKMPTGKPALQILDGIPWKILSSDISITHEHEYACAVSCFLVENHSIRSN